MSVVSLEGKVAPIMGPPGRTGVPENIARAALFLVSDLSGRMTGAEIVVDGGMTVA
jgi:NAD(P)-dependent dehydrogenase (short-subunit alcohol dehydrogenase family)